MKIIAPEFQPFVIASFRMFIIFYALIATIFYVPTLGWSMHLVTILSRKFALMNIGSYGEPRSFWGKRVNIGE